MKYLEFEVKDMAISRKAGDKTAPISGSVNYYGVRFNFDEAFSEVPGVKAVEFFKNRRNIRVDLTDGACVIPNEFLCDKLPFEMRIISGNAVATPWAQVTVTESGVIHPEVPDEELPNNMSYVKSLTGDSTVAVIRKGDTGFEFSQNGEDWESGINGIPDVPKMPKNAKYVRRNGDWVQYEEPEPVQGLSGETVSVTELATDAELSAVIAKINEVIGALKVRGVTV